MITRLARVTTRHPVLPMWLVTLVAAVILATAGAVRADEIRVERAAIELVDDAYVLSADFEFELRPRLEEALHNGLSLYFVIECDITRPRWYWFDARIAGRTLRLRLWFHALTRQYRLSSGALSQSFATLADAQRALARLRSWRVADRADLSADNEYDLALRMRLDTSQLPKPFQVSVIGDRDWTLTSNRVRWRYVPTNAPSSPSVPSVTNSPGAPASAAERPQ